MIGRTVADEAGGGLLACLRAWALAHGLAKLLVESGLDPARYGVRDAGERARYALSGVPAVDQALVSRGFEPAKLALWAADPTPEARGIWGAAQQ